VVLLLSLLYKATKDLLLLHTLLQLLLDVRIFFLLYNFVLIAVSQRISI